MPRPRVASLLVVAVLAAAGVWGGTHLGVETDITHFLPASDDPRVAEVARRMAASELNRTITLSIEAPDADTAASAAGELGERLTGRAGIARAASGPDEGLEEAFYALYFPRRLLFASDDSAAVHAMLTDAGLRERARALKSQLASPAGTFVREIAPRDPWLLFPAHLSRLRAAMEGALEVHDGRYVSADGRHGIVLVTTETSPFDTAAQAEVQRAVTESFAAVDDAHGGALTLEQAGVHRLAMRSEREIRDDVLRVSIAGTAGVVVFLILVFGSLRYLVLGQVPIAAGFACALAVSALAFGRVHGLTLAFGATLIGVALDYVAHYLNHHVLAPAPDGPWGTMRRIWPGLSIGGLTTVAGVAALAWTGYPAIREMAVFTSVGVLGALLATRWLIPPWLPDAPRPTRFHRAACRAASRALEALARRRALVVALPLAAIALTVAGALRLETRDDAQALAAVPPDLLAEDARVRDRVARVDAGRFVLAIGDDVESALEVNDHVYRALEAAREDDVLGRQRSLHPLLWSAALQRESLAAIRAAGDVAARTDRAYAEEGFVDGALDPFHDALEETPEPLRLADLEASPLASLVEPFMLRLDDGVAVLTFLSDVRDEPALRARLDAVPGARLFDQKQYMEAAYAEFRVRTFELVVIGLAFVLLVVAIRYRDVRRTLAAVLPAVLAGATAIGIVSLIGEPITLVHVVTLLLVLSMGVDYGVFMVESTAHRDGPAPTVVSLVVACASTVLSFGALALSAHPAMRAIGLTTALGVAFSLLLAPAAVLLLPSRPRHGRAESDRR